MPTFLRSRTDVEYTGYDLLPVNIEHAKKTFKNETWQFSTFDLVKDKIGRYSKLKESISNLYKFQETNLTLSSVDTQLFILAYMIIYRYNQRYFHKLSKEFNLSLLNVFQLKWVYFLHPIHLHCK